MSTRARLAITLCSTHLSWNTNTATKPSETEEVLGDLILSQHWMIYPRWDAEMLRWVSGLSMDVQITQPITAIFFPRWTRLLEMRCPWWLNKHGSEIKCAFVMCPVKRREVRGNSQKQFVSSELIIIGCLQDKLSLSLIYFIIISIFHQ